MNMNDCNYPRQLRSHKYLQAERCRSKNTSGFKYKAMSLAHSPTPLTRSRQNGHFHIKHMFCVALVAHPLARWPVYLCFSSSSRSSVLNASLGLWYGKLMTVSYEIFYQLFRHYFDRAFPIKLNSLRKKQKKEKVGYKRDFTFKEQNVFLK
jgi:hypothetical protein